MSPFSAVFLLVSLVAVRSPGLAQERDRGAAPDPLTGPVVDLARLDDAGRRAWLIGALRELSLPVDSVPYVPIEGPPGVNLTAGFGSEAPEVLVAAHFDRVRVSPGANDNASGCAVLLALARRLRDRTLAGWKPARRVRLLWTDHGTAGAGGAGGWLDGHLDVPLLAVLSLDLVGVGDSLAAGPADPTAVNEAAQAMTRIGARPAGGLPVTLLSRVPPSDHVACARRGIDAITLLVAPRTQIAALAVGGPEAKSTVPEFLKNAGGVRDTADQIRGEALSLALQGAETWIDEMLASNAPGDVPRPTYSKDQRAFVRLLDSGAVEGLAARTGRHVELMTALGPRGVWKGILVALAEDPEAAGAGVARILETFVAGSELRAPIGFLLEPDCPTPLAEGLRSLLARNAGRMIWDPAIPAITLRTP